MNDVLFSLQFECRTFWFNVISQKPFNFSNYEISSVKLCDQVWFDWVLLIQRWMHANSKTSSITTFKYLKDDMSQQESVVEISFDHKPYNRQIMLLTFQK